MEELRGASDGSKWVEAVVRCHVEHLVDSMATVIVRHVDLPPIELNRAAIES